VCACFYLLQSASNTFLAPLRLDTPFKRAFQDHVSLAHLLNSILNDTPEHAVTSITRVEVKPPLHNRASVFDDRACFLDVFCTLANGSNVIIELQRATMRELFNDRLVGYVSRAYREQWRPRRQEGITAQAGSTGRYTLTPVKVVALVDFTLERDVATSGSLVQNYSMCARAGTIAVPAALQRLQELCDVTVVQLPLAPKDAASLIGAPPAALWAHLLRYSQLYSMHTLPEALQAEPYATVAASVRCEALTAEERAAVLVEEDERRNMMRIDDAMDSLTLAAEQQQARADEMKARADVQQARAEEQEARVQMLEQQLQLLRAAARQPGAADVNAHMPPGGDPPAV
jgi:hypothetical protein